MALATYRLPKDNKKYCHVIQNHVSREEGRMSFRRLTWLLAWYYINGARRFDVFNPSTGALTAHFVDEDGNMEYQCQELVSILDRTVGRLKEIDLLPKVFRADDSLAAQREKATMQVLMDSAVPPELLEDQSGKFIHLYALLGCAGITGEIFEAPARGLSADFEVIHPKELFPFPSYGTDYTKPYGVLRQRVVPLTWLKERFGRKISDNEKFMEVYEAQHGSEGTVDDEQEGEQTGAAGAGRTRWNFGQGEGHGQEDSVKVARIRELWIKGPGGLCEEYGVSSGDYVIQRDSYEGMEAYCPIGLRTFIDTGTFHGAGMFDLLFSTVREMERLLKSVYNNIRDTDKYGFLVLPHGGFHHDTMFKDVGHGLRVAYYEPDYTGSDIRPFMVSPYNAGDAPGKVAGLAKAMVNDLSPIKDLAEEKGRIDSATGLQFLDEQMGRYMTNATNGLRGAFSDMYRSLAAQVLNNVTASPRPIPVDRLTIELAGVVIDPDTSSVDFENNPLPGIGRMQFGVRGRSIQSQTAKLERALEMVEKQLTDPLAFRLYFLKEGMDPPLWMEEEKSAYKTIVQNILRLFGDGQNPGMIIITPHNVMPKLQIRVLNSFMDSPLMGQASVEVQNSFIDYRESLLQLIGPVLPPGVPQPDDLAAIQQEIMPQLQQQGGQQPSSGGTRQGASK
jgi:hypothetical protein